MRDAIEHVMGEHVVDFDARPVLAPVLAPATHEGEVMQEAMKQFVVREPVVRGMECELFDGCPMRRGDGTCFCWQARRRERPTKMQMELISAIEETTGAVFGGETRREASDFIDRHVEAHRLLSCDAHQLAHGYL